MAGNETDACRLVPRPVTRFSCQFDRQLAMASPLPPAVRYSESPEYASMYRESVENPGLFWGRLARSMLTWVRDYDQVMDCCLEEGKNRWFLGGQLNVSGVAAAWPISRCVTPCCSGRDFLLKQSRKCFVQKGIPSCSNTLPYDQY